MNIKEIEQQFKQTPMEQLSHVIESHKKDERSGVQKLILKYQKKINELENERHEWELRMAFDRAFAEQQLVVGIDEVGRGPLAGPVVAAAVILPPHIELLGLKDSKKLSSQKRKALYKEIKEVALAIGIGIVRAERIDEINILQATFEAMREALGQINRNYDCLLVDGNKEIPMVNHMQHAIIGGDNKSASIAAASVIAKVTRDQMMEEYAKLYPGYDWESNKGYGSLAHYEGIRSASIAAASVIAKVTRDQMMEEYAKLYPGYDWESNKGYGSLAHYEGIRRQGMTPLHRKSFLKNEGIV